MTTSFLLGKGTKLEIAMLPEGSKVEPSPLTLTIGASAVAKDITSPASIPLTAALAAGKLIPAGSFLGFKAPTTGKIVMVQLIEDAAAGDTELVVESIPEEIAGSSTATYPLRLSARTNANIGRSGNRVSSVDFDSGAFETGLTASISQTLEMNGNYLPNDAGFRTTEYAFTNLREVYIWVELPRSSAAYSKGKIYKGFASIGDLPIEIPADGIITGNVSLAINGEMQIVAETPVA